MNQTRGIGTVNVYGLGYIGLPTAAILASVGYDVTGIDIDEAVTRQVQSGLAPHKGEPGLDELLKVNVEAGRLRASTAPFPSDVHIIAVGTPVAQDHTPDLSQVEAATRAIASVLRPDDLVLLESTVPPGTCEQLIGRLLRCLTGLDHMTDYHLAHCPERVIPGSVLHEITHNDRVLGGTTKAATHRAGVLYRQFSKGTVHLTDAITAEMCKLMENTFRDVNIALANQLADIAATVGVDIDEAIKLANFHPRVALHRPGIGVGGHCIPVDPWFLIHADPNGAPLLRLARQINDNRPILVAGSVIETIRSQSAQVVCVLGLSYKADVDDFRESPAIKITSHLASEEGLEILVVEPNIAELPNELRRMPNVRLVNLAEACQNAELIVRLVAHRDFEELEMHTGNVPVLDAHELMRRYASPPMESTHVAAE